MKSFKDNLDRNWTLNLNVQALKRVRSLAKVDLLALDEGSPPLAVRLATDVILLCDVLFALVKPDADEAGLTDEDFARGLGGDGLAMATGALGEELKDFFQRLGRKDLARVVATQEALVQKIVAKNDSAVSEIDLDQLIEDSKGKEPGSSSTGLPASSGSTPAPSPSGSSSGLPRDADANTGTTPPT
jgi:hypothetical protein